MKKNTFGRIILHTVLIGMSLCFVLPLALVIIISFSSETSIAHVGYSFFPNEWSIEAYKIAFKNLEQIIDSYFVTSFASITATLLSLLVQLMAAYPLAKSNFKYKKAVLVYALVTMIFSGGLIPSYIINTRMLHLQNTIWVYIFPTLASAWNVLIMRSFIKGLSESIFEAARIDGASEYRILFRIILPLSVPVLATLGFKGLIVRWNDWNTALIYIREPKLYSLQYLLQKILREAEYLKKLADEATNIQSAVALDEAPSESLRFAMAVIASGPMLVVFPFFQKYLAKGLVVGSVKG